MKESRLLKPQPLKSGCGDLESNQVKDAYETPVDTNLPSRD